MPSDRIRTIIGLASAVAVAVAVAVAATPAAAAAPPDDAPSREMVDSMVADLGLTPAQARDRIRAEGRASRLQGPARAAAGEAYAGAFFDPAVATLVVGVTDPAVLDAVRATGAEPRVVENRLVDLEDTLHVLDSRTGTAPDTVTGWRVDEAANLVAVDVVGGPTQADRTFVAGLKAVRVDYGAAPVATTANLVGGDAIFSGASRCSLGFSARRAAGPVVITAGHCTNVGTSWNGFNQTVIGSRIGTSFPVNDYGAIAVTNTAGWVPTSLVKGGPSVLGSADAAIGSYVCRSGATTGYRCGTLQARNQTVAYPQGTVYGLGRTSACAQPGDSGGSFISSTRQAQGVVSGGSGNCTSGGTTFFQPVNEILAVYGLTLVVG